MVRRGLATLGAVVVMLLGLAQPAHAATGGVVINASTSVRSLTITHNWCGSPGSPCGSYASLFAGQSSRLHWADTDGFLMPSGCSGWVNGRYTYPGGRWYKINDLVHVTVHVSCP
jgi:hypothetical protein